MSRPLFPVRFSWSDIVLQSYASDVSESAMFVACPNPPPEETKLALRLFLPDGREPEVVDAVVRSASEGDRNGFVCELVRVTPSGRERLRGAIPRPTQPEKTAEEPAELPPGVLREIEPEPQSAGAAADSPLRDIVLGALDEGEEEVPVSKIMAPPGPSVSRPLPPRAAGAAAPARKVIPVIAPERRVAPRAAVHFKVSFGNARKFVEDHAQDISAGGMFVATARAVPVGTIVQLTLALPDGGEPVETHAQVARIATPQDGKPGLGLQFLGRDPQLSSRLLKLVESCSLQSP